MCTDIGGKLVNGQNDLNDKRILLGKVRVW